MRIKDAIRIAQGEIGVKEEPKNSNRVKYNTWFYGREVQGSAYPWCCAFICWVFRDTNLVKKTASCSDLVRWFKQNGQFYSTPQEGDLVFYNFHTPSALADHVGIVEAVESNGSIFAIEGNTSLTSNDNGGCVMRRHRSSSIVGYGRPKYNDVQKTRSTIKMGSKGADVTYLQTRLTAKGYLVGKIDGDFGVLTKNAVLEFQREAFPDEPKEWDGIVGQKTWSKLG